MAVASSKPTDELGNEKVQCLRCKDRHREAYYHRLDVHLQSKHKMTVAEYLSAYPGAPTISAKSAKTAVAPPKVGIGDTVVKGNIVQTKPAKEEESAGPKPFKFKSGVMLYKRDGLSELDKLYIPQFDIDWEMGAEENDKWESMAAAISEDENVLDVGPTGCGKTAGVHQLAAVLDQPVRRVQMSGELRVADFLGTKVVEVDAATGHAVTRWQDGILVQAYEQGHWLVLDEIDSAPPAILFILHAVLEKGGKLVLSGDGGRVVKRHPHFRVFATANTLGRGDDTGMYTGTNILNEAFLDRFGVVLASNYPAPEIEAKILVNKARVNKTLATRMVEVATKVREALAKEECYCTFSTRRLITWAQKSLLLKNTALAARVTVLNKLSREDAEFVGKIIQRIIGSV